MATTIDGNSGVTFPAGGTGNPAGTVVGTTDTQTLTNKTLTSPTITGASISSMSSSIITAATAQASTSGTSIDFTGIPSWVKRITVMVQGVSTNGSSPPIMRLGTASGFVTSGYATGGIYTGASTGSGNRTDSFLISGNAWDSNATANGHVLLTNITGNTWVQSFTFGQSNSAYAVMGGGSIALAATLTQIRITTANGTDAFDSGSINIFYE
jgi:hypothetical protein